MERFFQTPTAEAIPKPDLSTFVLDLMIYLMSYELCLMTYLMSYVILSSYDLTALVYVLLLRPRLTISRLVSMHFVLCRFVRILEDMSFLSSLRILILLEEPPHLPADVVQPLVNRSNKLRLVLAVARLNSSKE